jgi:hypothetical protein
MPVQAMGQPSEQSIITESVILADSKLLSSLSGIPSIHGVLSRCGICICPCYLCYFALALTPKSLRFNFKLSDLAVSDHSQTYILEF